MGNCKINVITDLQTFNTLMNERERKSELEFDNHRRLGAAHRNNIGRANLCLHDISLILQKGFHGRVKIGFSGAHARHVITIPKRPATP